MGGEKEILAGRLRARTVRDPVRAWWLRIDHRASERGPSASVTSIPFSPPLGAPREPLSVPPPLPLCCQGERSEAELWAAFVSGEDIPAPAFTYCPPPLLTLWGSHSRVPPVRSTNVDCHCLLALTIPSTWKDLPSSSPLVKTPCPSTQAPAGCCRLRGASPASPTGPWDGPGPALRCVLTRCVFTAAWGGGHLADEERDAGQLTSRAQATRAGSRVPGPNSGPLHVPSHTSPQGA